MTRIILLVTAMAISVTSLHAAEPSTELWVYAPVNFQVDASADKLIALLERAKKAGYAAAVVTDYKFGKLDERPDHYWKNLRRTRDAAERIGVELIPCVMPIGYSNSLLQNDPDLAEAMPVIDCEMIVRGGRAVVADATNLLDGGGFERGGGHVPFGWNFVDGFGSTSMLDREVNHGGVSSLRMGEFRKGNEAGNARVMKRVSVKPGRQYQVSVWVRTAGLDHSGELHIKAIAPDGRMLQFANLGVKRDQEWTRHAVLVNTMGYSELNVYVGLWGGAGGTFWLDDAEIREVAGANMVRRDGCPLRVVDAESGVEYVEGRDFERWVNAKTGREPYAGEYRATTEEPAMVIAKAAGEPRIKDGTKLRVSFWHTMTVYDGQAVCCLLHPRVFELLKAQVAVLHRELRPRRWFMQHDELRLAGWCGTCAAPGVAGMTDCGKMLAENARRCVRIIRDADPDAGIIVWSDMFDPHHNAVDRYYLAASTLAGSWEGLDKSVTIANWNAGKAAASLGFFAKRGHGQVIAGYYDDANVEANVKRWRAGAAEAGAIPGAGANRGPLPGAAWMYTTWRGDYANLARFAKAVRGGE